VGNVGKVLIAVGLLMFGFVGYQLYGTGIETAAAQNALEDDFNELLAQSTPIDAADVEGSGTITESADTLDDELQPAEVDPELVPAAPTEPPPPSQAAVPVEDQNLPSLENGEALARIEIPRIGVDDIVVAGVDTRDLKKGPGHFPDTPLPGQLGNSAIAGHPSATSTSWPWATRSGSPR
jgi:sortase A